MKGTCHKRSTHFSWSRRYHHLSSSFQALSYQACLPWQFPHVPMPLEGFIPGSPPSPRASIMKRPQSGNMHHPRSKDPSPRDRSRAIRQTIRRGISRCSCSPIQRRRLHQRALHVLAISSTRADILLSRSRPHMVDDASYGLHLGGDDLLQLAASFQLP